MTVPYVSKSYFWIPRQYNANQETGTYASFTTTWNYVTDDANPPSGGSLANQYTQLHLPTWFPQTCLIHKTAVMFGASAQAWGQVIAWIDPAGAAYNSTTPHGQEAGSNFTQDITIGNVVGKGEWYTAMSVWDHPTPVTFDRTKGDKLVVEIVPIANFTMYSPSVQIYYLVPNTLSVP